MTSRSWPTPRSSPATRACGTCSSPSRTARPPTATSCSSACAPGCRPGCGTRGSVRTTGWQIYDGLHDSDLTRTLLDAIVADRTVGTLRFCRIPGADDWATGEAPGPGGLDSLVLTGEQSNTSLVFGESAIFKVFRRVAPGPNPDLEVAAALAELGSTHIAEPYGWVETRMDGATTVLAILSRYLRAASDGWSLAATSVRDLYATEGARAAEAGGDFAGEAERLGVATAQVHADLADGVRPLRARARGPPRAGRADVPAARHRHRGRARAGQVRRQDRRRLLQPGQADRAGARPAGARRLPPGPGDADPDRLGRARLRGRARQPAGPAPGPVLPAAGRGRHAPLVRLRGPAPAAHPSGRGPAWRRWPATGCGATATRSARATPPPAASTRPSNSVLLRALLLDKAVYEVIYEARNRPTWLAHPARVHRRDVAGIGRHDRQPKSAWARSNGSSPAQHHDPHSILGAHPGPDGVVIRALRPLATSVAVVLDDGRRLPMTHLHQGVFAVTLPDEKVPDYRIATYVRPERRATRR